MSTTIQWTDETWNPVTGCSKVSAGCKNCYAEKVAERFWKDRKFTDVRCHPERLDQPLHWKTPRRIFVNSMSDLFHEDVPADFIDRIFAVMALSQQHTYQVLTKRPERMGAYVRDPQTPFRVAKAIDALEVARAMVDTMPETRPAPGFPGYFVSNEGVVFSGTGSAVCVQCGGDISNKARSRFCSSKCRSLEYWRRKNGKQCERENTDKLLPMSPDIGDQGHLRVMLRKDGAPVRVLVHRLVLTAFVREPIGEEQACHRSGDPSNNHIANLRWGTQSDNWDDRRRHGHGHSHGERQTVPTPIDWPLANCWKGTSVENQATADARIPILLQTPAAVRFLSVEPLLESIDLATWFFSAMTDAGKCAIDWVIVGGESGGHDARPCNIEWVRDIVRQCRAAGVSVFVKQIGSHPHAIISGRDTCGAHFGSAFKCHRGDWMRSLNLRDRKGGDPAEWPEDLRVREYPRDLSTGAPSAGA
jgi:protein gp37